MPALLSLAVLAVLTYYILRAATFLAKHFRANVAALSHIPGYKIFIHPNFLISAVLPRWGKHFNIGEQYSWRYRHGLFSQFNSDLISIASVLGPTRSVIVSDPEAIKFIVSERKKFVKPLGMYTPLAMYGPNVGVSEGTEYLRHKKIVAASNLLDNINFLAWEHTMKTLDACFEEWEEQMQASGRREVKIESLVEWTLKVALYVVLGAAFSHTPPWKDDAPDAIQGNHKLSFRQSMHGVLTNVWWKIFLPSFAYKIPYWKHPQHVQDLYYEYSMYMSEMVQARRVLGDSEEGKGRLDLLGAFVKASSDEARKEAKLTDQEVMSNIYVFLLAGHDTTAHTLAFTFGLLALYPDIQQELYDSVLAVLPDKHSELTYEHVESLHYSLAVFLETLRVYPSVVLVPKYSVENTFVPVRTFSSDGGKSTAEGTHQVMIPNHTQVLLNVPGLHYNPRYWGEDASVFRPSRFIDDEKTGYKWPREAFMAFSQGARQCLGQKFAQVEAVTIISEIIRKFEIVIDPSVLREGESVEQARVRLLDSAKTVITLTPKPLPVIFRERK